MGNMLTLQEALRRAYAAFQSGQLAQAERLCHAIIAAVRDCFDALRLLAAVQSRLGRPDEALDSYERALAVRPEDAGALNNHGIVLTGLKQFSRALASFERALEMQPDHVDALNSRGVTLEQHKRLDEALVSYEYALAAVPDHPAINFNRANVLRKLNRCGDALACYDKALSVRPNHAAALGNRGIALHELERYDDALASYERALAAQTDDADAFNNLGNTLKRLGRLEQALQSHERALTIKPELAAALACSATILHELKRFDEAVSSYDRALAAQPADVEAIVNRAGILGKLKRYDEALVGYQQALEVEPDNAIAMSGRGATLHALTQFASAQVSHDWALALTLGDGDAFRNRGVTLQQLKQFEAALASHERALELRPDNGDALNGCGVALHYLKRFDEALRCYERTLAFRPDHTAALNHRGNVLFELRRFAEALRSYEHALAIRPDFATAMYNYGNTWRELKRYEEARTCFGMVTTLMPTHNHAIGCTFDCATHLCDWARQDELRSLLYRGVSEQTTTIPPFQLMAYSADKSLLSLCARTYVRERVPAMPQALWRGSTWRNERIKVAYVSADFRRHATAHLTAELFELHDRSRFEVIGISLGRDDRSEVRARLAAGFDRFIDVQKRNDIAVAQLLSELQVDIVVDLMGHTKYSRPGIFSHRPAPIQVSYLGFPGTTGADFIDYVIADANVVPFDHQCFFSEKIVHLPDTYWVIDRKRKIAPETPTREEMGLPSNGFVFCCFNNNWKITPPIFDIWMRLLQTVEGSVLWLLRDNEGAQDNLRREASARGIDPERLVFARRIAPEHHLARQTLADLFLDTLPYNAHTTASDALWLGLPIMTCQGDSFAGRVAASLLNVIGLPELVTTNLEDYEALALKLARTPALLMELKARLARNRYTSPLFDTDRFCHNIEVAYSKMWEIWQSGGTPCQIAI